MTGQEQIVHTTHAVDVDGHRLFARGYGHGEAGVPVMLVHGLAVSIDGFPDSTIQRFRRFGPVYSLSLPGHAPSLYPSDKPAQVDSSFLAKALAGQIQHLVGEQPVVVMGHSSGGTAAMALAIHYPHLCRGLIACNASATGRERMGAFAWLQQAVRRFGWLGAAGFNLVFWLNSLSHRTNRWFMADAFGDKQRLHQVEGLDRFQHKYWPNLRALNLRWLRALFSDLYHVDMTPHLPQLTCPTLVVAGGRDPYVSAAEAEYIAEAVQQGELLVFDDGGHLPFLEHQHAFHSHCEQWLERLADSLQPHSSQHPTQAWYMARQP